MDNVGHIPSGGGIDPRLDLRPAAPRRPPEVQFTQNTVTPPTRPAQQFTPAANSLSNAAAYARGAAQVLSQGDPLKSFSSGLSTDLTGVNGDIFASAGRLGALHNAHSFALAANAALRGSPNLQPIA